MQAPRISSERLGDILKRAGYGIHSQLGKGTAGVEDRHSGPVHDVEPNPQPPLESAESLQIRCAGKVTVRFKFYRRRLADYSRAISEKAAIDSFAYAGLISGDTEKEIRLIDEGQEKVETNAEERTEFTLEYPEVDFNNLFEPRSRKDGR